MTPLGSPVVPDVYMSPRVDSTLMFSRRGSGIGVVSDSEENN
jgi:hypothetical protein